MRAYWRSGELFVWTTAFGVAVGLLMIAGLLALDHDSRTRSVLAAND